MRLTLGVVVGFLIGALIPAYAAFNRMPVSGSAVTVTTCGVSASVVGNSVRGQITLGAATTACTVNFTTAYPAAPTCVGTAGNANASVRTSAVSTAAVTFTLSAANTTMYYVCLL